MRKPWTPEIVPSDADQTFYFVIDRFRDGPIFREVTVDQTDLETVLSDLATGQYSDPQHVIAFNVREGWSKSVSRDIADELQRRADLADVDVPYPVVDFVDRHSRPERQLTLRLAAAR